VLLTARAHIERAVVERFAAVVDAHPQVPVLARLRDLHALSILDRERGWFLEEGMFAPAKTRAVQRQVNALCGELRTCAAELVDGFGIPDALLDAPIAGVRAAPTAGQGARSTIR
jgi:acyl-CoA oxidase